LLCLKRPAGLEAATWPRLVLRYGARLAPGGVPGRKRRRPPWGRRAAHRPCLAL